MKHRLTIALCFCLLGLWSLNAQAQYVYSDSLINASLDFHDADSVVDNDRTNYGYVSNLAAILTTSHLHVHFSQPGKAGDALHFTVQGTGQVLGLGLLSGISVKFYDASGVLVDTRSGTQVLQLSLLSPQTGIYGVRVISDISKNYNFHSVRVEFHNLLTANLLNEFRVYNIYYQAACPPLYATGVHDYKTASLLSPSRVDNPGRTVDANPNNYATMEVPLNLLGIFPPSFLDLSFTDLGRGGDYVGVTVGQGSSLLSAALLQNVELSIYDDQNVLRQTKSGFNLLDLKLVAGTGNRYTLGFMSNPGNYKIARVRITLKGLLSLLVNLNVYNAFHYAIDRPAVTVTLSGPDRFCQGGSVTLTAYDSLGGTQYFWNTGDTTASITVTQTGTYFVQVTDTLSCTRYSVPIKVTAVPNPKPQIVGDTVVCAGTSGVLRTALPYAKYRWSDNSTADSLVVIHSGKYFVQVEDSLGCTGTDSVVVIKNSLTIVPSITAADCPDGNEGEIALNVNGGSGKYAYHWSNGLTGSSIQNLSPGLYAVMVTDTVHGCSYNRAYSLSSETNLSIKKSLVHTRGCGMEDGKVQITVIGGGGNYSYAWSHGPTTANLDSLSAGIYTLLVTDLDAGCTVRDTVVIHDGASGLVIAGTPNASSSCSTPNGSVNLTTSGGTGPYTYTWADGATGASRTGLAAGTYYVLVRDQAGCHQSRELVIPATGSLTLTETLTRPSCQGANGKISLSVSGGSGNYSYLWSNGSTTSSIEGLVAGIYEVTVTDNNAGCKATKIIALGEASGPSTTAAITAPLCGSNSNGAITLTPAAATYRYAWSNGSASRDQMGLKPGRYSVRITDTVTGCTQVYAYVLDARPQIELAATPSSNTSCASAATGEIQLDVKGGTPPLTYAWSHGPSTQHVSGLNAGTYSVLVSDAQGCTQSLSVPIRTDSSKLMKLSLGTITAASCNTSANGSAQVTVTGGRSPYTYSWSNGATTKDLLNVVPGTYTLTVTDALGCTQSINATIGVSTVNPILVTVDSTWQAGCAGSNTGAAFISVTGGKSPYSYSWSNGAKTQDITGLIAGTYVVTVTDANGCTETRSVTVPVAPSGSFTVALDSVVHASCSLSKDGAIYAHPIGGQAPYSYLWSNGATTQNLLGVNPGTYTLTVIDNQGCPGQLSATVGMSSSGSLTVTVDSLIPAGCSAAAQSGIYITASGGTLPYTYSWSTGANTEDLTNVVPGTYTVTVTDALGCNTTRQATTLVDTSYTVKAVVDSTRGAGCVGGKSGALYVSVVRGQAPYSFSWSNGATTEDLLDVSPGSYTLITTDAGGCTHELQASVLIDTNASIRVQLDSMTGPACATGTSGAIYVSVNGGVAPYTYSWSTGATSQDLTGVGAGTHTLTVFDAAGCSKTFTETLAIDTNQLVKVTAATVDPAGCLGSASGAITLTLSGGTAPYRFAWSNGDTTQNPRDLSPGSYSVTITDASGCSNQFHTTVGVDTVGGIKIVADKIQDAVCEGSLTGSIQIQVSGGTPPYNYLWSNGALSRDLSFVAPGVYNLEVTDAKGCKATFGATIGVNNINPIVITVDSLFGVGCLDSLSGEIYVSVSGGQAPYDFLWSNGATTPYLRNVGIGNYNLTVHDEQGCTEGLTTFMDYADSMLLSAQVYPVNCFGQEDGRIQLSVENGRGSYTYAWSHGADLDSVSGLKPGSYQVTVTDQITGCLVEGSYTVTEPELLRLEVKVSDDSCAPMPIGSIELLVSGGTAPYVYQWVDGFTESIREGLTEGNYGVEVRDAHDCSEEREIRVGKLNCDYRVVIYDVLTPNGDGANDTWVIEGLGFYPNHVIQVFNKWGDKVFETSDYKNDWNGTRTNGEPLADGTYFYLIRLQEENRAGGPSDFTGSLLIQR